MSSIPNDQNSSARKKIQIYRIRNENNKEYLRGKRAGKMKTVIQVDLVLV